MKTICSYFLSLSIIILLLLIMFVPNQANSEITNNISLLIDRYLFGDIGLISLNRPFMSKVIANYIGLIIPILGLIMFLSKSVEFEKGTPFFTLFVLIITWIVGFYFTYLYHGVLVITQKSYLTLAQDSLYIYFIVQFIFLFYIPLSIPYFLHYSKIAIKKLKAI